MHDLLDAWLVGSDCPADFCVLFKTESEAGRRKEHRYEAESPQEAAEIVAKLNHLASLHGSRAERFGDSDHLLGTHSSHGSHHSSHHGSHRHGRTLSMPVASGAR
jgi:hypothetical protein